MYPYHYFIQEEMKEFSQEQRAYLRRFWLLNYQKNLERMVAKKDKGINDLPDYEFSRPVAVIGAAPIEPSVFKMLGEWKDLTTVCCDKALPRVLPYFEPNFVTAVNTELTPDVKLEEWFKKVPETTGLIVPVTVHPKTVELWKGPVYWMNPTNIDDDLCLRIEQETGIIRWHRGLNVGEFSVAMGAFMKPAELALFGMWYAWKTRKEAISDEDPDNWDVVELCNQGVHWFTNITWLSARTSFVSFARGLYLQGLDVFNVSKGGILYHDEFIKPITPLEFRRRWQYGKKKGVGRGEREESNSVRALDTSVGEVRVPELQVPDAPVKTDDRRERPGGMRLREQVPSGRRAKRKTSRGMEGDELV